jgi:hypothetical protein
MRSGSARTCLGSSAYSPDRRDCIFPSAVKSLCRPCQIPYRRQLCHSAFSNPTTVASMPRKMKNKAAAPTEEPPTKRTKLFDEDAVSDDEAVNLTINEDFAKRFEHNKKREEKQKRNSRPDISAPYSFLTRYSRGKVQGRRL